MKLKKEHSREGARIRRRERILKTIGVLPSLATLGNLTCGVGAIYLCMLGAQAADSTESLQATASGRLIHLFPTFLSAAAYMIIGAMFLDALDGRLARLARKTSEFGGQLDSLADVVSFGVAPAFLVLCIAQPATFSNFATLPIWERMYWRAEWVMAAVFACCAALRLARFNVENEQDESAHMGFRGLPTPGAAGAIIGLAILHQGLLAELAHEQTIRMLAVLLPPFALLLGLLMVSPFRYPHIVNTLLRGRRPFWQVVSIGIVVLIGFVVEFQVTLAVATVAYALSGPVNFGIYKALGKRHPEEPLLDEIEPDRIDERETFDDMVEDDTDESDDTGPADDGPLDPVRSTG